VEYASIARFLRSGLFKESIRAVQDLPRQVSGRFRERVTTLEF
jgi:hypothetical protein